MYLRTNLKDCSDQEIEQVKNEITNSADAYYALAENKNLTLSSPDGKLEEFIIKFLQTKKIVYEII
jgi:hypothetical protein